MFRNLLITTTLAAALLPAAAADASGLQYARFTATVSGAQTTEWSSTGPIFTDCNGTRTEKGEGTEVFRFDSGKPRKVLLQRRPGGPDWKIGTWDPYGQDLPLGLQASARLTRQGKVTTSWTGGWCGHPPAEVEPENADCGQRRGFTGVVPGPYDGRLKVDALGVGILSGFKSCPVNVPTGVDAGAFTASFGRFSNRLAFGHRRRIVIEAFKKYPRHDPAPGVDAVSTTHFRIVLVRHGR